MRILVMGDSYSAGNGAGDYFGAKSCRRSHKNYAELYYDAIQKPPYDQPATFDNVACSGDVTAAITGNRGGRPPQVNAVSAKDNLIFLTLGGDDIDFSAIVQYCLIAKTRAGANCGPNLGSAQHLIDDGEVGKRLAGALHAVGKAAPRATIVLLGYPFLESDLNYTLRSGHGGHTFIAVGRDLRQVEMSGEAAQEAVIKKLDNHTQRFVFISTEKLFAGTQPGFLGPNHELTAKKVNPDRWFIQPFVDAQSGLGTGAVYLGLGHGADVFYHPNPTGWQAEAQLLISDPRVPKHPDGLASQVDQCGDIEPGLYDVRSRNVTCVVARRFVLSYENCHGSSCDNFQGYRCSYRAIVAGVSDAFRCVMGTHAIAWRVGP
jgi:GDSL-like Lipase/Acylhydrolase family